MYKYLIILLIPTICFAGWDDPLPSWIDNSETYKTAGGAVFCGVGWPMIISATHDVVLGKPKTFDGRARRTLCGKLLASIVAEALWHGKMADHDADAKTLNIHLANMITIAPALIWDGIQQYRYDKRNNFVNLKNDLPGAKK